MNGNQTSSRLRHAIILALGLGISNLAFSLRLGPINVKSYLGQPINATIRVDGLNAGAASGTKVSLASPAAYRSHGIEMLPIHSQMRFSLVPSGKGYIIHVSSTGGVKEPFINFLLTVSGNGSTVTREYAAFFNPNPANTSAGKSSKPTVILEKNPSHANHKVIAERSEPPKTRSHAANTSGWGGKPVAKKPVTKQVAVKSSPQSIGPEPSSTPTQTSASPNTPASIPVGSTYGPIKPGETLYSIAKAARPSENMRIYDMMRLIYKANRRAFIGNDMGNLMAGATLHIPDPGNRGAAKPTPEKKPAAKPAPKQPERKTPPPQVVEEKKIIPENIPTSPAAQLALGMDKKEVKTEIPTPVSVVVEPPPILPQEEKKSESANQSAQGQDLTLDSPESIDVKTNDVKTNVEVPPPVIELPKPEPVEEIKPEPQPEPKPVPRPAPEVKKSAPKPAPVAEDDSFFGLGKFFTDLGIPLPILGGAFAGLLALIGGLFWFLKKRKKPDDQMEEFTEEEINQLVAEMEEENGDLDFDQITSSQNTYDESSDDQPRITKLDPISEPYEEDASSLDELSDDFFKDLEVSVEGSDSDDTSFIDDDIITDNSEINDNFFDDLEFESDTTSENDLTQSNNKNTDNSQEDFLSDFDDKPFTEIDSTQENSNQTAEEVIDDFDDFFSSATLKAEDDFFADESLDSANENNQHSENSLDFFEDLTTEPEPPKERVPEPISTDTDDGLDFFADTSDNNTSKKEEEIISPSTDSPTADDNSLDFFTTSSAEETNTVVIPENDFFADESKTSSIELEKKEIKEDDNSLDFFTDPVAEAIAPESDVPAKPSAPSLAKPSAPELVVDKPKASPTPQVDEEAMEINLDMAKSFISMGKSEKARSWLEEVLDIGTEEQKVQAQKMLASIDKG